MTPRLTVEAKVYGDPDRIIGVSGQTARTLVALVDAGDRGVTALEVATWALRLAAYVHELRHNCGLAILMDHEPHDGGWHGRYRLVSAVDIIAINGVQVRAA